MDSERSWSGSGQKGVLFSVTRLFPNVPLKCLPTVNSSVMLLHDLEKGHFTEQQMQRMKRDRADTRGDGATPPLNEVSQVTRGCRPYRAAFEATRLSLVHKYASSANGAQHKAGETAAPVLASAQVPAIVEEAVPPLDQQITTREREMLVVLIMNYRYCLASSLCPQRMAALRKCWSKHGYAQLSATRSNGALTNPCEQESKGVERCAGHKVQRVVRSAFDDHYDDTFFG